MEIYREALKYEQPKLHEKNQNSSEKKPSQGQKNVKLETIAEEMALTTHTESRQTPTPLPPIFTSRRYLDRPVIPPLPSGSVLKLLLQFFGYIDQSGSLL